jgi:hypothetical protein
MSILSLIECKRGGYMKFWKKAVLALGVFLWVGALSPEIFVKSGKGCIFDENGKELDTKQAYKFMESFFYGDEPLEIEYRFALFDLLGGGVGK